MKFEVFYCEDIDDGSYLSDRSIHVEFKNRVLRFPDGKRIEVSFEANNEVTGHYDHINSYFYDKDEDIEDDARKYFARLSQWKIFQLRVKYKYFWWQHSENIWKIIVAVIGTPITVWTILR